MKTPAPTPRMSPIVSVSPAARLIAIEFWIISKRKMVMPIPIAMSLNIFSPAN
jgi:hypothetical protein